jgi:hypothetical protein
VSTIGISRSTSRLPRSTVPTVSLGYPRRVHRRRRTAPSLARSHHLTRLGRLLLGTLRLRLRRPAELSATSPRDLIPSRDSRPCRLALARQARVRSPARPPSQHLGLLSFRLGISTARRIHLSRVPRRRRPWLLSFRLAISIVRRAHPSRVPRLPSSLPARISPSRNAIRLLRAVKLVPVLLPRS